MRRMFTRLIVVLMTSMAWSFPGDAAAWDYRNDPFNLRLPLALERASLFTDVVGLSASTAYPYGSSVNPANDDFLRTPPNNFTLAATSTGIYVPFETGASITASAWSLSYRLPTAGTITFSYSRSGSHDADTRQGDTLKLDLQDFTLGYSHLITPNVALGGEFKITDSTLHVETSALGFPANNNNDSMGYDFRLGVLAAVSQQWLVGLSGGAGWTYTHSNGQIEVPVAFGGPVNVGASHTFTRSVMLRGGVGWRPSDKLGVYADAQYLRFWDDDASVSVARGFAGVEFLPIEALALRVGGSIDSATHANVSAGIGFYAIKHLQVEFAYSYNAFPEIRHEFGAAHLLSFSAVLYF